METVRFYHGFRPSPKDRGSDDVRWAEQFAIFDEKHWMHSLDPKSAVCKHSCNVEITPLCTMLPQEIAEVVRMSEAQLHDSGLEP